MAGHNKWSKIKRKKGVNDAKRGALFTKLIREITVAAKEGGGSVEFNARLRLGVETAKAASMPAENIERAIKKGTGELEGVDYQEVTYEGYGPGGVALYIECLTDNTNRTVADIRHALSKCDGSLGTDGSVAWQFERKGQIVIEASKHSEDDVFEAAIEAGAEDINTDNPEVFQVITDPSDFDSVRSYLEDSKVQMLNAELIWNPQTRIVIEDNKKAEQVIKLIDLLEEDDDVQSVHTNFDISENVLVELG